MSEKDPTLSDDERRSFNALVEGLDSVLIDPAYMQFVEDLNDASEMLPGMSSSNARRELSRLNKLWESCGWVGEYARVTGRLRFDSYIDEDDVYTDYLKENGVVGEDSRGKYYDVKDLMIACMLMTANNEIAVQDDDNNNNKAMPYDSRFVFSFCSPEELIDAHEDEDEDELDDLLNSSGGILAYAEDIEQIVFDHPSIDGIGEQLRYHYPGIYKHIHEVIEQDARSGVSLHRSLKKFELPRDVRIDDELRANIADYIFARLDPDNAPYEFWLDGKIYGIGASLEQPEYEAKLGERLTGKIVGIDLRVNEDGGGLRVALIVAERHIAYHGSYEGRIIPIDSVEKIRAKRPSQNRFGNAALIDFSTPQDIKDYWHNVMFGEYGIALDDENEEMPSYDAQLGGYLIPINADIQRIVKDFNDHVAAAEALDLDTPMSEADYAAIAKLMESTLVQLENMKLGDQLVAQGNVVLIDETEPNSSDVIVLDDTMRIQGEIVNTLLSTVPEMAFYSDEVRNVERTSIGVGVLLANCKLIESDGDVHEAPFMAQHVMIIISPNEGTNFYKLSAHNQ